MFKQAVTFMESSLKIRSAVPSDAPILSKLLTELGYPSSDKLISERLHKMNSAGEQVLVAVRNGNVLGLLTTHVTPVLHRPTPVGRLTALVVTKDERGKGIGRALVATAERMLKAKGCDLIEVTSNIQLEQAHLFYKRLGYEATSLRFKKTLHAHS
jgi:GNAT superfamily N-acetyltransferase